MALLWRLKIVYRFQILKLMEDLQLQKTHIFWFRRDLRLDDNRGLAAALEDGCPVLAIFIFDTQILDTLSSTDARVSFIHQRLKKLNEALANHETTLLTFYGSVQQAFERICSKFDVQSVYCNHDYEPYAVMRDNKIMEWLGSRGIGFHSSQDQVIYEKSQVMKGDGTPYTVFTPYMKAWKSKLNQDTRNWEPTKLSTGNFLAMDQQAITGLETMGFSKQPLEIPDPQLPDKSLLNRYQKDRDYPARNGTSRLSVHLRFGTISIRKLVKEALEHSDTWLNELIWREFYMMILWHFPHVVNECFKPEYNFIPWKNSEEDFDRWCKGQTGYPLVDAGMRELNQTGYMHNRLRMITASFLSKHLLINWQWGEAYFAEKLLDFELSSNNGGWQWSAGCGCDAAPYFRVFNPWLQAEKFDPESEYTRRWVPEYQDADYPEPMVDHRFARSRAIETYQQTLQKQ